MCGINETKERREVKTEGKGMMGKTKGKLYERK